MQRRALAGVDIIPYIPDPADDIRLAVRPDEQPADAQPFGSAIGVDRLDPCEAVVAGLVNVENILVALDRRPHKEQS